MPRIFTEAEKIVIRPSSLVDYLTCSYKWYNTFIGRPELRRENSAAAQGTAIHAAAEYYWSKAIKKETLPPVSELIDVGKKEFDRIYEGAKVHGGMLFQKDASYGSTMDKITRGTMSFYNELVPMVDTPVLVEYPISHIIEGHPVVKAIRGTIDYIGPDYMADIKTSGRKPVAKNYALQQATYRMLLNKEFERTGDQRFNVSGTKIFAIVLGAKASPVEVMPLFIDNAQCDFIIKQMLRKLELFAQHDDIKPIEWFPGNPQNHLCREEYCPHYNHCPYPKGELTLE